MLRTLLLTATAVVALAAADKPFVHPGLSTSAEEITFIQARLAEKAQPWTAGLARVSASRASWMARQPEAMEQFTWPPHWYFPGSARSLLLDAEAAYGLTLLGVFANDKDATAKAITFVNAWGSTLKAIVPEEGGKGGHTLCSAYLWPAMLNAAELLRTRDSGWAKADQERFAGVVRRIVLPVMQNTRFSNNWYSNSVWGHLVTAVYLDDRAEFDKACERWRLQAGRYIRDEKGTAEEINRDLYHSQMGYGPLIMSAEVAWKQGVDLYSFKDNRVLRAVEYHIPFIAGDLSKWPGGRYKTDEDPRKGGRWWPMYECALNHYHNRLGIDTPVLKAHVLSQRPEMFVRAGWGSLLHAGDPKTWKPSKK